ncbi:hypothetical protein ENUP19_0080G0096 [Entamoeba nuttalli]|uniref:Uncharacterized protein n=1 Tax=Entamoeba nuttalli TaxID=412467 RepID=A0ABQ0DEZ5_9EUKA
MSKLFVESLDEVASKSFVNNLSKAKDSNATTSSTEFEKELKDDSMSSQIKKEEDEKKPKKTQRNDNEHYCLLPDGGLAKIGDFGVYKISDGRVVNPKSSVFVQSRSSFATIKYCDFGFFVSEKSSHGTIKYCDFGWFVK